MSDSEAVLYPFTYSYLGTSSVLLWTSGETGDHFVRDSNGVLLCAGSIEDARVRFSDLPSSIEWDEAASVDFDLFWSEVDGLSESNSTNPSSCEIIVNGWNFIEDILRTFSFDSLRKELDDKQVNKAYKKLFYGNNLEAVTPEASHYSPEWDEAELELLRRALRRVWKEIGNKANLLWGDKPVSR